MQLAYPKATLVQENRKTGLKQSTKGKFQPGSPADQYSRSPDTQKLIQVVAQHLGA